MRKPSVDGRKEGRLTQASDQGKQPRCSNGIGDLQRLELEGNVPDVDGIEELEREKGGKVSRSQGQEGKAEC